MTSADELKAEVRARVEAGDFVERLADRIGASMKASAVFGQPVERSGITVIPVAKATWGFAGGSGGEAGKEGAGGGGGGFVAPLGYIEDWPRELPVAARPRELTEGPHRQQAPAESRTDDSRP